MKDLDFTDFFPYQTYRKGQKTIIEKIKKSCSQGDNFILIAPNGTGKSIIGLSSVLPFLYNKNFKLIYLCRTYQQNDRIINELQKINKIRPEVNGISLRGRKNMCIQSEIIKEKPNLEELTKLCASLRKEENGCKYYEPFKNLEEFNEEDKNIPAHDKPLLSELFLEFKKKVVDINEIIEICKKNEICPYYFVKKLLGFMKIIICNYLWVFNPFILSNVLLPDVEKDLSECILIVDECHNLTDTVLEVNEKRLSERVLIHSDVLIKQYRKGYINKDYFRPFERFFKTVEKYFKNQESEFNNFTIKNKKVTEFLYPLIPSQLLNELLMGTNISDTLQLNNILESAQEFAFSVHTSEQVFKKKVVRNWLLTFIEFWKNFIRITLDNSLSKTHFIGHFLEKTKNAFESRLEIKPLDPQEFIQPILNLTYCTLHMSGTLIPEVYLSLTGISNSSKKFHLEKIESPFRKENIKACIVLGVTSAYHQRENLENFRKINQKINEMLKVKNGNVGIFCVSYDFLHKLNSKILKQDRLEEIIRRNGREIFREGRNIDNAKMIKGFKAKSGNKGAVLLGVLGGRNSEGEDFPGKDMEHVIIIGLPFAPMNAYIRRKISYFNQKFESKGKFFGYIEPAIRKANQAAGRPIRRLEDKGAIIFLDYRYNDYDIKQHLSDWINNEDVLKIIGDNPGELGRNLELFWNTI
ncbi:MAG: hypothetical protein CEE43_13995 [Promethearchaeota archaeon Loki_b32]|nr:MAG: hypothetical protein CEE43_13995 [Candidatus Lokiarchaeota archaeon Loki_b32]